MDSVHNGTHRTSSKESERKIYVNYAQDAQVDRERSRRISPSSTATTEFRRCASTPYHMNTGPAHPPAELSEEKSKHRMKFSLHKRWRKHMHSSSRDRKKEEQAKALENARMDDQAVGFTMSFTHSLMQSPEAMGLDRGHSDSEPEQIQTVCAPNTFSGRTIKLDKRISFLDTITDRVIILSILGDTAVVQGDQKAADFVRHSLAYARTKQNKLIDETQNTLNYFEEDPKRLLRDKGKKKPPSPDPNKVAFIIHGDDEDLNWDMSGLHLSRESSFSGSDEEGPAPEEVKEITEEIKRDEAYRYKHMKKTHSHKSVNDFKTVPPPPNPLGHSRPELLRTHATMPTNLDRINSSNSMSSEDSSFVTSSRSGLHRIGVPAGLPFNLVSLTGQLSWMITEYLERGSSTYSWATELIRDFSGMSVSRSSWLNVHQQLRDTTELLYANTKCHQQSTELNVRADSAWKSIQRMYESLPSAEDDNSSTVTAATAHQFLAKNSMNGNTDHRLVQLLQLVEKKHHLAYVCDLFLWRAERILFDNQTRFPADAAKYQLHFFQLRLLQLRLGRANAQMWSPNFSDYMLCWIRDVMEGRARESPTDAFCVAELRAFKISVQNFTDLVSEIVASEFMNNEEYTTDGTESDALSSSEISDERSVHSHHHHHHHHHPYHLHHGQGGQQQDLRRINPDRCSHYEPAIVQEIYDHAMNKRPLAFFAERALYDICMEVNHPINFKERLKTLLYELSTAYREWESLFKARFDRDHYERLFGSPS
ncbi:unnamed protein product [Calicophoron daubneyi]